MTNELAVSCLALSVLCHTALQCMALSVLCQAALQCMAQYLSMKLSSVLDMCQVLQEIL